MKTTNLLSWKAAVVTALLAVSFDSAAHGDLHDQIEALSREIEKDPRNGELYIRRGELHRAHQEYDAGLADFDQAATLDPQWPMQDFHRGRLLLEARWPLSARVALDRFLNRHPHHVEGRLTRARLLAQLGQRLAAARDYTEAIAHADPPAPEAFLARAQVLAAEGEEHQNAALKGIEEGIARLGPLVVLQSCALDLEVELRRYDDALARLDRISAQARRQESWLARRGEILRQAGRPEEAQAAFAAALAAIDKLAPAQRNVPAIQDLGTRLHANLGELRAASRDGTRQPGTRPVK